jgi:hypothetical protein
MQEHCILLDVMSAGAALLVLLLLRANICVCWLICAASTARRSVYWQYWLHLCAAHERRVAAVTAALTQEEAASCCCSTTIATCSPAVPRSCWAVLALEVLDEHKT